MNREKKTTGPGDRGTGKTVEIIFFELSNLCNFHCDFCPILFSKRAKQKMDINLFKKVIEEIAYKKITSRIGFHLLGEPLLHPDVVEAVKWAKVHGLQTELSTNGELLVYEKVQALMNAGLDLISISLETITEEEHKSRGAVTDFETYYKRILNAIAVMTAQSSMQITLTMMNTVSRKYFKFDQLVGVNNKEKDFKGKLARLIADISRVLGHERQPETIKPLLNRIKVNEPKRIRIHRQINLYVQLLMDWGNAFTSEKIIPSSWGYCGYAMRNIGILSDGRVTICCGDYDGHTSLGNVNDQPLSDILNSKQAQAIEKAFGRHHIIHPYCKRCLGGTSRLRAFLRGLLSIYLFKFKSHPLESPEISLNAPGAEGGFFLPGSPLKQNSARQKTTR